MSDDYRTLRSLLEHHIATMHLRPEAPWPQQCDTMKDMIKAYQRSQSGVKPHVARPDDVDGDRDADTDDLSVSVGA